MVYIKESSFKKNDIINGDINEKTRNKKYYPG